MRVLFDMIVPQNMIVVARLPSCGGVFQPPVTAARFRDSMEVDICRLLHVFRGRMVVILRVVTLSSSRRCRSETTVALIYFGHGILRASKPSSMDAHCHCDDEPRPDRLAHSEFWDGRNGNVAEMPFSREGRLLPSLCVLHESQPAAPGRADEIRR
jgi:hypothetical protein